MGILDGKPTQMQNQIGSDTLIFNSGMDKEQLSDIYSQMLKSTKEEMYNSVVETLAAMRWGVKKGSTKVKSKLAGEEQEYSSTVDEPNWYPITEGAEGLMTLKNAIAIANSVSGQVDQIFSSGNLDAGVNIVRLSALEAMLTAHLLDNPRLEYYKGTPSDAAMFAVSICSKIHNALSRSQNGFFVRAINTSTTNAFINQTRQGDFTGAKKETGLNKLFGLGNAGQGRQQL